MFNANRLHATAVRLTIISYLVVALLGGLTVGLILAHLPAANAAQPTVPACAVLCDVTGSGAIGDIGTVN